MNHEDTSHLNDIDRILVNYTHNELPIYSKESFSKILEQYPNKNTLILFRGINFRTEEDYKNFMQSVETNKGYLSKKADSFAKNYDDAFTFAETRPTYFLNESLMRDEDAKIKNKERLIGYCGVIVKIEVPPNSVIDLAETDNLMVEDEALVCPKNIFPCEIEQIKTFKLMTEDPSFQLEKHILQNITQIQDDFLHYLIHHHQKDFTDNIKEHLFNIANAEHHHDLISRLEKNQKNEDYTIIKVNKDLTMIGKEDYVSDNVGMKPQTLEKETVFYPRYNKTIFELALNNMLREDDLKVVKEKSNLIVNGFSNFRFNNPDVNISKKSTINIITQFCTEETVKNYQQKILSNKGEIYRDIQEEGRKINTLKPEERKAAIKEHTDKLVSFLEDLIHETPKKKIKNKNKP